jgi:hypothetical protein
VTGRTLSAATYRRVDRASKLLGVAVVAVGLEVGGATGPGLALALVGVALGTATVFVEKQ